MRLNFVLAAFVAGRSRCCGGDEAEVIIKLKAVNSISLIMEIYFGPTCRSSFAYFLRVCIFIIYNAICFEDC